MDTKQQLVDALAGLGSTITEAMDVIEGFVPCGHPALTVSNALVALDVDDDAALAQQLETVEGFIDHVSENRGVAAYHGIEVDMLVQPMLYSEICTPGDEPDGYTHFA